MSLEASFPEICPWQDEYDPDCPTELLVDGNEVDEYEPTMPSSKMAAVVTIG